MRIAGTRAARARKDEGDEPGAGRQSAGEGAGNVGVVLRSLAWTEPNVARRRRVQHVFVRACVMWRAADVSISTHALPFSAGTHSMHKYALPVVGAQ